MKLYKPALYDSPISFPESRSGPVQIKHRQLVGHAQIIGLRQAVLRGVRPVNAALSEPRTTHELVDNWDGVWMTDSPEELNQIHEMLHYVRPHGRVLVGGLGLGIVAKLVAQIPEVKEVEVIERCPDVVKLCCEPGLYGITVADIHDFLRDHTYPFDYYLLDTWQGTGEGVWWKEVFPMRRVIRNKFGNKPVIHCWAEDIMLGQVCRAIQMGQRTWHYEKLPANMTHAAIRSFTSDVGSAWWEERYGRLFPKGGK